MSFNRLNPGQTPTATWGSIATNSSGLATASFAPEFAGEVVNARLVNGTTTSVASGTTVGSAVTINLYKTSSAAASLIATWNGSGTAVATRGTAPLTVTTASNARFAAGDVFVADFVGGAANNASNAGAYLVIDYVYGRQTGATPAAGTGPA